jgi:hypothetical protein
MEQVRVNLTLEQEIWKKFGELIPNRKKSKIINELLKKEIKKRIRQSEENELNLAFQEASMDKERRSDTSLWESLDAEGWN